MKTILGDTLKQAVNDAIIEALTSDSSKVKTIRLAIGTAVSTRRPSMLNITLEVCNTKGEVLVSCPIGDVGDGDTVTLANLDKLLTVVVGA